jgi:hypothetical protein
LSASSHLLSLFWLCSLRWRATKERHSHDGWCGCAIVVVFWRVCCLMVALFWQLVNVLELVHFLDMAGIASSTPVMTCMVSVHLWRPYSRRWSSIGGVIKSYAGWLSTSFIIPLQGFLPLFQRWMTVHGAWMCCKRCFLLLRGRLSSLVWPLVGVFLTTFSHLSVVLHHREWLWIGVATRGGVVAQ